jgi:hypothetical protein
MLQTICIIPNEQTFPTDIGLIAENLLYYKQVIIIVGTDTLPKLLKNCDIEILQELITRKLLRICICENFIGVFSQQTQSGITINDVTSFSVPELTTEEFVFNGIFKSSGRRGYSKRATQKLLPFVESIKYDDEVCDMVREDLCEHSFIKSAILNTIQFYIPDVNLTINQIQYEWVKNNSGLGYLFNTNLDYEKINKLIPNNPSGNIINPTNLIGNILHTRGDMHLASTFNAEITTTAINTSLMKLKFKQIYENTTKHIDEIFQFNDFVLSNGFAIREAINSGDKEFKDFIEILNKADKFKSWLDKIDGDKSIIKEYHEAVTRETWVDKLPSKSVRWSLFTGVGLLLDISLAGGLGTAIGIGVSFSDTFLLDKLLKGWKPNVFVEKDLKKIITK